MTQDKNTSYLGRLVVVFDIEGKVKAAHIERNLIYDDTYTRTVIEEAPVPVNIALISKFMNIDTMGLLAAITGPSDEQVVA